jgi:hypothetical protein
MKQNEMKQKQNEKTSYKINTKHKTEGLNSNNVASIHSISRGVKWPSTFNDQTLHPCALHAALDSAAQATEYFFRSKSSTGNGSSSSTSDCTKQTREGEQSGRQVLFLSNTWSC